ncbi:hypothetical protein V2W45_535693 [Cenococcum geophilum]
MDTCRFPQTSPSSPEFSGKDFNPPFEHFRIKAFLYTEVFEDNRSHASWSAGHGTFFDGTPDLGIYDISFSVYKDRTENTIDITVHSDKLLDLLQEAFELDYQSPQAPQTFGYARFLPNYEALKTKLLDNESRIYPNALSEEIVELGLFVREFLTERAIFDSFGLKFLREQGILSVTQWKDIQSRSIQDDLDDLDESFNLSPGSENETSNETFEDEHLLDPETQSRLRSAIWRGDVAAIETLLSQKIGLADPDTLIRVLMSDDLAIFRSFLIHGAIADGDTPDHFNGPLYTAAEHGCFRSFGRSGPLFAVAKCGLLEATPGIQSYLHCMLRHLADIQRLWNIFTSMEHPLGKHSITARLWRLQGMATLPSFNIFTSTEHQIAAAC